MWLEVGDLIKYRSFRAAHKAHGVIVEVQWNARGTPRYLIHWLDNGVEAAYSHGEIEKV